MASFPNNTIPAPRTNSEHISSDRSARITDMAQSSGVTRVRNDESWVEIASQPSSSSLSSIGDEIVTTGLRVQHDPNTRRRRRVPGQPSYISLNTRQASTSSQEEYEESESESDRAMTSSNEHTLPTTSHRQFQAGSGSDSDDDDENATALGRRTDAGQAFTPQPNAFSHPPTQRPGAPGSYFPPHANTRQSYPPRASRQNSGYNNTLDHDAALRASLNTLLSIGAAAARGLPKRNQPTNNMTSNEPMGLRFVPESELLGPPTAAANTSRPLSPSTRARSSPSVSSQEAIEKGKRKAAAAKPTGEKSRALKKKRMQASEEESMLSPTLLTWVMSAGVVVLVSVVGFGAGYVIGREVGRGEAMTGLNGSSMAGGGGNCRREVARSTGSLRRFKWGIGGAARGVVA
ncbi:hypothetical protein VTL71DRAFT_13989 [Oculimacula yallundae]|uniref:Uncharacterized protein n=1 Tax=Oculimacula yallundae TaxID=86028 RepID=A0ABR4CM03_9HELO